MWWLVCLAMIPAACAQPGPAANADAEPLKGLPGNVLRDQKAIWTSPFHIKRKNAGWWLSLGAVTGVLIATDHRASQQLPNTGDQLAFSRRVSQVGAVYTLVPITAGAYLGGALTQNAKLRETGVLAGEALLDGLIVSQVLKFASGRQRPLDGDGGGHFFHGGGAFPSGHTMGSFALASVIAHRYPDKKALVILSYGLAALVGASRFSARQHYGSDIVVGGAIGWFIGRHVTEARAKRRRLQTSSPRQQPHE